LIDPTSTPVLIYSTTPFSSLVSGVVSGVLLGSSGDLLVITPEEHQEASGRTQKNTRSQKEKRLLIEAS
jgi:hypothetical protein